MSNQFKNSVLVGILMVLMACSDDDNPLPEVLFPVEIEFRALLCPERGGTTTIEAPEQTVINDENNYLHQIEISDLTFDGEIPSVDFETETVIAVNMGQQGSSGFSTEITNIIEFSDQILVQYQSVLPIGDPSQGVFCTTNSVLTSPYCIVAITKTDKLVVFEETVIEDC